MSHPLPDAGFDGTLMTVEAFLDWSARHGDEAGDGAGHELVAGRVVAMAPERNRHIKVKQEAWLALRRSRDEQGLPCDVLIDGATVPIDERTAYRPDVAVQCGEPVEDDSLLVPTPVILVEVLSPSTSGVDLGEKLMGYFSLPSVRHYLVIDPVRRRLAHHRRGDDGTIVTAILGEGRLRLDPPGLEIDVAEVFQGLR